MVESGSRRTCPRAQIGAGNRAVVGRFPVHDSARPWVADHVALIGDAAHSVEPSLGQGGSLTLNDVDVLLDVLDACFAKSDFSARALKGYEEARRSQTEVLQRMAELTAMLTNTSSTAVAWFRDRTLHKMRDDRESMMLALEIASGMKQSVSLREKLKLAGLF